MGRPKIPVPPNKYVNSMEDIFVGETHCISLSRESLLAAYNNHHFWLRNYDLTLVASSSILAIASVTFIGIGVNESKMTLIWALLCSALPVLGFLFAFVMQREASGAWKRVVKIEMLWGFYEKSQLFPDDKKGDPSSFLPKCFQDTARKSRGVYLLCYFIFALLLIATWMIFAVSLSDAPQSAS